MAALFAVCVALPYNDPDPIRWMAIYGVGALVAALIPIKKPVAGLGVLLGLVALAWALYLVHATWGVIALSDLTNKMSEKGGAVEEGREAGGLAIMGAWLLFAAAFRGKRA
jgi:hypothetical protein